MTIKQLLIAFLLTLSLGANAQRYSGNPILMSFHADPEVMYSHQTGRYYIYSTTDGTPGWGGWYFTCFSSADLTMWKYEGIILNLPRDTKWASGNAWAPCIEEKLVNG
ncbi:MAG: family 43 glycosylhydrolase, partial [Prevotella sp.]|nr:family 43 glycosylhydrolase [Prevotella sp.]